MKGFSVVEMLVVVAVFAIGSLSIAATFLNFSRLHKRVANAEVLGEDIRFTTELLIRAARNNTVAYPPGATATSTPMGLFVLKSLAGTSMVSFKKFTSADAPCSGLVAGCLAMTTDGSTWTAITGKYVNIDRFDVYVTPTINPFYATGLGTYNNNSQPRITFVIDATYVAPGSTEKPQLSVQTSVSSRIYLR
jgi:prepilin-type N-terminal cleavage/methylation domain-containing protein